MCCVFNHPGFLPIQTQRVIPDPYPQTVEDFFFLAKRPCGWDLPQAIAQDNLNDVISNIAALWAPEAVVVFFFFEKNDHLEVAKESPIF